MLKGEEGESMTTILPGIAVNFRPQWADRAPSPNGEQRVASSPVSGAWGIGAGALAGLAAAPLASMIVARPPLLDATEPLGLPFRCDHCAAPLRGLDALPVVSFVARRGRCRSCAGSIPLHQPITEIALVALSALIGWRVGWTAVLPAHLIVGFVAVCVVMIDYRLHKIPTKLVYPAAGLVLVALLVAAAVGGDAQALVRVVVGGLAASAFLWILVLSVPTGMGQGDARLCLLLGMILGWHGWRHVYLGLVAGFVFGSIFGIGVIIATRLRRGSVRDGLKAQIAFGPYLCAGALLFSLWPTLAG
jgi:leader peptidase (prepilin peptidase) / N-methyltransferase